MWVVLALPSISEVITDKLHLWNAAARAKSHLLDERGITHVQSLQVARDGQVGLEAIYTVQRDILQLGYSDELKSQKSIQNIAPEAIQFINQALCKRAGRILVQCSAGVSRSPAIATYWLFHAGLVPTITEAVRMVRSARPIVKFSFDHMESLRRVTRRKGRIELSISSNISEGTRPR